jgi:Rhodopirellula transposase DDE domain
MGASAELLRLLEPQLRLGLPVLDERARRLVLGMVALAAGDGGTGAVARMTGASWQTVADGKAELESGQSAPQGRVRRPGGGRKKLAETDPGLLPALLALVEDSVKGDPQSPLVWTTKSVQHLSDELTAQGHRCSPPTVWRMLHGQGYCMQSNAKAAEGRQHPDRDAQFRYIAAQAKEHLAAGQPVISVDAKKKEQVGEFAQAGAEWRPGGDPVRARDHSFPDRDGGHAIPYGVYDVGANTGFVNVGTDRNTAALAVESVRRWWNMTGKDAYPQATRLLVTCDAGGNNGHSNRSWKTGMAGLAQETGLQITICHFPPGTSKWNKIEHRLFSQITLGWRGRPLTSYDVIINTIAAVTTRAGLTVTAVLDENPYPKGAQISDAQMQDLENRALTRHDFHGAWNYTFPPVPRPAPAPAPAQPPPPSRCDPATLDHPALTGLPPGGLAALTAALQVPFDAAREQRLHTARGGPRVRQRRTSPPPWQKISYPGHIMATVLHLHLALPAAALAPLLGADRTTTSRAIARTRQVLAATATTITPAPAALATFAQLRDHAAAAGITIPAPAESTATTSTITPRDTPET